MSERNTVVPINADIDKIRQELAEQEARLKGGGGDGISGDMSEDSLKPRVDFLHTAFLWLAGALITAVVAVIGVNITMSNTTNNRIDKLTEAASTANREAGEQSVKIDESNRRLERIEGKLDTLVSATKK